MKKIIFRKIAADCLNFFLLTIISISVIIWVLQAVNFLDFVVEDGHGFPVYMKYTLLNFPKIFTKIFPFALFFSISYIILKYEDKNELVIFWNIGIHKIKFINFFLKISFLFLIVNLLLTTFIIPKTQDVARSYIRSSDIDLFESMIKPKKFVDTVKKLTIFVDEKKDDGELINIFLKEENEDNTFQTIFAKFGRFEVRQNRKILVLYDGMTINNQNNKISEFGFSKTDFNISKYGTKTISNPKTQEISTYAHFQCLLLFKNISKSDKPFFYNNCSYSNLNNIKQELYKRIIIPLYNPVLIMISLLLILKSKNDSSFKFYRIKVFTAGFLMIMFSQVLVNFVGMNIFKNIFIIVMPFLILSIFYFYNYRKLKLNNQ